MSEKERMVKLAGITEANLPKEAYGDGSRYGQGVWLTLDRTNLGGYYRLEGDEWFRLFDSKVGADGYGLMIRSFRVSGKGKVHHGNQWDYVEYPLLITYLPTEFDDPDDDIKANYEKAKGKLFIRNDITGLTEKTVAAFVKSKMSKYKP